MPWTNIPNANLAAGAPIRSVDIIALRDNIAAQANGDAGSPQQQTAGIANGAVTSAKLATGTNERDWVLARTAGATAGAVGTYAILAYYRTSSLSGGSTLSGSSTDGFGGINTDGGTSVSTQVQGNSGTITGTWRLMGFVGGSGTYPYSITLWLRIA